VNQFFYLHARDYVLQRRGRRFLSVPFGTMSGPGLGLYVPVYRYNTCHGVCLAFGFIDGAYPWHSVQGSLSKMKMTLCLHNVMT